jgi:DNA polymerase (family 10)
MSWLNEEVAGLLREYAELTQITGGDVFRARNYEKAARSVRGWADDVSLLDAKAVRAIPGVGASIAAKIAEYRATGSIRALDELRATIPPGVLELTRVPGLGPKRALQLSRDLGVQSVDDLADLGNMPYGVGTAQRGWLTPDDVINTWPLDRLRAFLRKGR